MRMILSGLLATVTVLAAANPGIAAEPVTEIRSVVDIPASIRGDFTVKDGSCAADLPAELWRYHGVVTTYKEMRLVIVPCGGGGAYNQPYALYLNFGSVLDRVSFPDVINGIPSVRTVAMNVDFDGDTGELTAFDKDRGLGDCGEWMKWRIDEDGNVLLVEKRYKEECDGAEGGVENFPLIWPVKK